MTPRRLKLTSATLLAANLVPLCGVLWWQWSVSSVIVLYWFENIIIGVINVARMIAFSPADGSLASLVGATEEQLAATPQAVRNLNVPMLAHGAKLFMVPFFVFHYFFFCAGHGVFVFSMFPDEDGYFAADNGIDMLGTLGRAIEIFSTPLAFAAVILASSHVVSFFVNYLGGAEYRRLDVRQLMMMPYGRIVVLHLTIIFGGFATMALGEPVWVVVILVLVKMVVDLKMHLKEHRTESVQPGGSGG
jgi:hypothetical protein